MNDDVFIPTELKMVEDQYNYLRGLDYNPQLAAQLLAFSIELQRINLQARMIASQSENQKVDIDKVAEAVIRKLQEGISPDETQV